MHTRFKNNILNDKERKYSDLATSPDANEMFNFLSHFLGSIVAILGLIILTTLAAYEQNLTKLITFSIYGFSLIFSLLTSSFLHLTLYRQKLRQIFVLLDHIAIYILIAGTFTPPCLVIVKGRLGWLTVITVWLLAIINIILKTFFPNKINKTISLISYLLMGWLGLLVLPPIYQKAGLGAILYLIGGGVIYTIGAVIFFKKKPKLFPYHFSSHELWHTLVLAGHLFFYLFMLFYVLPF